MHSSHEVDPKVLTFPNTQNVHFRVLPAASKNLPAGQASQTEEPAILLVESLHVVQLVDLGAGWYSSAPQFLHFEDALDSAYLPGAHSMHAMDPGAVAYLPCMQAVSFFASPLQ